MDLEDFDAVFRGSETGYDKDTVDEILQNQGQLGGKLFFQRLLELLGIKWRKVYPPPTTAALHDLHARIISAPISLHNKQCLLFYILKDLTPSYQDQTELASAFASSVHLEKRFWTFLEGLWALDHLELETAVGYLTHPFIIPTFPDEIMLALLNQRLMPEGVTNAEYVLPMAYYNCAKPPLVCEAAKTEFVRYMADRDVTETFYWIRGRPDHERRQLLEVLVEETLEPPIQRISNEAYAREDRAEEFVSLPFDAVEEAWVEAFLTEGKGRNYRGAQDTVIMRRMATGRLRDAVGDRQVKGKRIEHVNWDVLKDGVRRGLGPRKDEVNPFPTS
ncbi:uncharacterized protein BDR25DRAFT_393921 [Lindgomyces ingoldianus]|uniref:Uncharacterized protein n=1 Tax=Lindgomyces ingoldianus TaxID=673940 RepID=A0ACB6QU96_9PLEO|nr:uncharacterized protein BDR25DRAFT_393921 [Lindgomyces ingoldianus]KAF2470432.1 hypothetical protein BDR25DRAFT_393921 [Lindgomyces ingoldianus]